MSGLYSNKGENRRKQLRQIMMDSRSNIGGYLKTKRKPSPRKLEPHEVIAMLKARKVKQ